MRHVNLIENTSVSLGGGLFVEGKRGPSFVFVEDSLIKNNTTPTSLGGGVYNSAQTTVQSIKIVGNQADQGTGVYNDSNETLILFSTKIDKNIAVTDGEGIFIEGGDTVVLNTSTDTIVAKNRPNSCSGDVPVAPDDYP